MTEHDLIIIGGGSAGLVAAAFGTQLGARVALVEKHRIGGDCTWNGCVPSKTLLKVARIAQQMRHAERYGLTAAKPEVDQKAVMAHVHAVTESVAEAESPQVLRQQGIDVHIGQARFVDAYTIAVDDQRLIARHVLLCTGARPASPPITGLEGVRHLNYESVWTLEDLPCHLLVLGGGPIGCEMAQAFRRLGADVTLLAGGGLLPRDDRDAASVLSSVFTKEGIDVRTGIRAKRVWQDGAGIHVAAGEEELVGDALLVATG